MTKLVNTNIAEISIRSTVTMLQWERGWEGGFGKSCFFPFHLITGDQRASATESNLSSILNIDQHNCVACSASSVTKQKNYEKEANSMQACVAYVLPFHLILEHH